MMEAPQSQTRTGPRHFEFSNRLLFVLKFQLKLPAKDQGPRAKVQTPASITTLQQIDERKKDEEKSLRCLVSS